ncbi:hypothetical protein GDO81_009487 [Engystomops pustulosus]|uniref:Secreted protein n=1 Tax=Engystomops pustulosus TaxID=76066 RepID=A0AAV7BRQ5_ENGPU|nr:hypothetical protein GDO81_009487 [Engystomops pustulosus]
MKKAHSSLWMFRVTVSPSPLSLCHGSTSGLLVGGGGTGFHTLLPAPSAALGTSYRAAAPLTGAQTLTCTRLCAASKGPAGPQFRRTASTPCSVTCLLCI